MHFSVLLLSLFAVATLAGPLELFNHGITCGRTFYTTAQIADASKAACKHVKAGTVAESSDYPRRYNNYERFNFLARGPWYEFPIKTSGVYTGGSPGADRVIINASCRRAGQITHTDAGGNDFVGCSGTQ